MRLRLVTTELDFDKHQNFRFAHTAPTPRKKYMEGLPSSAMDQNLRHPFRPIGIESVPPADEARVDPGTPVSRQTKRSRKYERRIASLKKFELWFDAIDLVEACFPSPEVKVRKAGDGSRTCWPVVVVAVEIHHLHPCRLACGVKFEYSIAIPKPRILLIRQIALRKSVLIEKNSLYRTSVSASGDSGLACDPITGSVVSHTYKAICNHREE